jgi:hypothetical protein
MLKLRPSIKSTVIVMIWVVEIQSQADGSEWTVQELETSVLSGLNVQLVESAHIAADAGAITTLKPKRGKGGERRNLPDIP